MLRQHWSTFHSKMSGKTAFSQWGCGCGHRSADASAAATRCAEVGAVERAAGIEPVRAAANGAAAASVAAGAAAVGAAPGARVATAAGTAVRAAPRA